jgi:hypothetical protein
VRLSREYELAGGLVVEGRSEVLTCRNLTEADVFRGSTEAAPDFEQAIPGAAASAGRTFADCFELQIQNVVAAVRGAAPLWAPAEGVLDGIGALATMETTSGLLESSWLGPRELETVHALRARVEAVASR